VTTNTSIDSSCAAAMWLSDGARLKGVVSRNFTVSQEWDYANGRYITNRYTNHYADFQATYSNGFGTGATWYTPPEPGPSVGGGGGASQ
jgi:hypothetical protein